MVADLPLWLKVVNDGWCCVVHDGLFQIWQLFDLSIDGSLVVNDG